MRRWTESYVLGRAAVKGTRIRHRLAGTGLGHAVGRHPKAGRMRPGYAI